MGNLYSIHIFIYVFFHEPKNKNNTSTCLIYLCTTRMVVFSLINMVVGSNYPKLSNKEINHILQRKITNIKLKFHLHHEQ